MLMNVLRFYLSAQGLSEFIPQVEDMLQYGCWCQILKERLAGKGLPTDAYDNLCRKWQKCNEVSSNITATSDVISCLQCAVMDFSDEAEEVTCVAATALYELTFDTVTRRIVCDKTEQDCGRAICQCDER